MKNKRRDFLKFTSLTGLGILSNGIGNITTVNAATPAVQLPAKAALPAELVTFNRFPRMVHDYFVDNVKKIEQGGEKRRASLKNKADAEAYVRDVRRKISDAFGPWPEKTPLNAKVTGTVERDTYNIEKVIFESRPGFPVTANLYIPKGRKFPLPAVVGTCGHGDLGKGTLPYQSFAQGLARQGYIVLIFDPMGQGERIQYLSKELTSRYKPGVTEHIYSGNQLFLTGENLASWFTWDGIRAIDYLLTRKEVDPNHIGVTGNSGGGTQTTWLCGVDDRVTMAAPGCFVITFRRNLENENPADTEQCPPKVLGYGLDHSDFIAAMAPKPVILLSQEKDFFDVRGAEESYERLKKLYKLLGAEQNIQLFVGPDSHGYFQPNREAMYGFFNKVTGMGNSQIEPALTMEKDETLWCTLKGQVGAGNVNTVFSISSQLARTQKSKRKKLNVEELKNAVIDVLKLQDINSISDYRIILKSFERAYPKKTATTYAVETEPTISTIVYRLNDEPLYSRPSKGFKRAVLYVSHLSADAELRDEPLVKEILQKETDAAIFAMDVRGVGESKPNTCGDSFNMPYGNDYFYAIHSLMLDKPYVGQKTYDVLSILSWLKSTGHDEVHLVAKGWGAFPATFAALLSPAVKQITLKNALTSYSDIAESEEYNWPLATFLPDVIRRFDLPDCYAALSSKKIRQIDPWNALANT
ncbi:acetylxylan esterase [Daejeonella sp.]|uniref:alpha/beta hydrolase n=1 Tax=Daejeonella sp. TaxID=2805397 RepID=UPI0030C091BC